MNIKNLHKKKFILFLVLLLNNANISYEKTFIEDIKIINEVESIIWSQDIIGDEDSFQSETEIIAQQEMEVDEDNRLKLNELDELRLIIEYPFLLIQEQINELVNINIKVFIDLKMTGSNQLNKLQLNKKHALNQLKLQILFSINNIKHKYEEKIQIIVNYLNNPLKIEIKEMYQSIIDKTNQLNQDQINPLIESNGGKLYEIFEIEKKLKNQIETAIQYIQDQQNFEIDEVNNLKLNTIDKLNKLQLINLYQNKKIKEQINDSREIIDEYFINERKIDIDKSKLILLYGLYEIKEQIELFNIKINIERDITLQKKNLNFQQEQNKEIIKKNERIIKNVSNFLNLLDKQYIINFIKRKYKTNNQDKLMKPRRKKISLKERIVEILIQEDKDNINKLLEKIKKIEKQEKGISVRKNKYSQKLKKESKEELKNRKDEKMEKKINKILQIKSEIVELVQTILKSKDNKLKKFIKKLEMEIKKLEEENKRNSEIIKKNNRLLNKIDEQENLEKIEEYYHLMQ